MPKKLLSILALTILAISILTGCSGSSPTPSTLTILSINDGTVLVMKAGTGDWTEATVEMSLGVGDTIKTGADSGAEITFFDGSTIELEAGTQIEITSLDSSPDTGTKTITLMQTIGTTISRVTALLDPASTYAIETPSGVAAVRGTTMIVWIVFNDPNYEDGTVLVTSVEGDIWVIWNGVELRILEGYTCVIRPDGLLELIPPNEPPQEEGGDVTDEDTSDEQSEDEEPDGSPTIPLPDDLIDLDDLPSLRDILNLPPPSSGDETSPSDGENPPSDGEPSPPDGETTGTIHVVTPKTEAQIFIQVETAEGLVWATDLATGSEVDGTNNYGVSDLITLAANHHYYVWVGGDVYEEQNFHGWESSAAPAGYSGEQAHGDLAPGHQQNLQFGEA